MGLMTDVAATRFGPPLPDGGTIGVCSPSGPYFNRSDILRPVEWWEAKGYRVKLADGAWAKDDYVAGSPERRAADLNALFADPEVDVIQVLWGGTGAIDVLPHLDYDLIAANPKALMGYSDITNLHIALRQRTGLATFHGPGLGSMGIPERTDFTWNSALEAFRTGAAGPVPRDPDDPYVRAIAGGTVTAPIVGGNLFTFVHLIGTPFDPVFDGAILMFEEVHEPPYVIDVHLSHLTMAGKLRDRRRSRRGRAEGLRLERGPPRGAPHPVDRGCARAASSPSGGPGAIQAASRPREASREHPAGRDRDLGRGRQGADDRPTWRRAAS